MRNCILLVLAASLVACGGDDAGGTDDAGLGDDAAPDSDAAESPSQFAEADGYVVMEMESVAIPTQHEWVSENELADFRGSGYYRFTGNGICGGVENSPNSPLRYSFSITNGSRYELHLRAARIAHCVAGAEELDGTCVEDNECTSLGEPVAGECADGDCLRTDVSNDAFVKIEDIEGNYIAFVDQPAGTIPQGIKLFGGATNAWAWTGKNALDPPGAMFPALWDLPPGHYVLIVEGRSQSYRLDRIVLFDEENGTIDGAEDRPETLAP